MSCVCIIPARGNSQRIPLKNIKMFHGKPIIAYSIAAAKESGIFDRVIVSTDNQLIAAVAQQYGAEVIMRSEEMSRNEVGTQAVMSYALSGIECEYACCLYPCAPMVSPKDLIRAYRLLREDEDAPYIVPVATWLCDPGMFYFGRSDYFVAELPLNADGTKLMHLDDARECDINTPDDWTRAEQMYTELQGIRT